MTSLSSSVKVATPYAEALFESSKETKALEKTNKDLHIIKTTIEESQILKSFLANPLIIVSAKKEVLKNLFLEQVSNNVLSFLFILIERRRINLFNSIVDCYTKLVNEIDLVALVKVYTVAPLNTQQQEDLQKQLEAITKLKKIQLIIEIKPELIGGLIVQIGSKIIDMSIYGQLNQIHSYLNEAYQ